MNTSIFMLLVEFYFLNFVYSFSLNPAEYNGYGDPAPGRSPGPPISEHSVSESDSLSRKCRLEGNIRELKDNLVNLTLTHKLFKTDVLVPDITYQVVLKKDVSVPIEFMITSSVEGIFFGKFPTYEDCGPYIFKSRLTSNDLELNWSFHLAGDYNRSSVTFILEYSPNRDPYVYKSNYMFPVNQNCQLQLKREESDLSNLDLPPTSVDCQVWFPFHNNNKNGIIVKLTRLNVPCRKGFVDFSGFRNSSQPSETTVYSKSRRQLCGKLEELSEVDRHVYFPAPSPFLLDPQFYVRPTMYLRGNPTFSISYYLVDFCHNITFFTRNGSFELQPKEKLQCTVKIHLPYGNKIALKLWLGNSEVADTPEATVNFSDNRNELEECNGLFIQLQDGNSFWSHCTKPGDGQSYTEIVSRENKLIIKVVARTSSSNNNFGLKMSYRAQPIESVMGRCDFGWVELSPFCIGGIGELKLPWAQAENECSQKGGHLVSVTSKRHQNVVDNLIINR